MFQEPLGPTLQLYYSTDNKNPLQINGVNVLTQQFYSQASKDVTMVTLTLHMEGSEEYCCCCPSIHPSIHPPVFHNTIFNITHHSPPRKTI